MADDEKRDDAVGPERLPYEPPSITWDEPMPERPGLTMACAKVDATAGGPCDFGSASS